MSRFSNVAIVMAATSLAFAAAGAEPAENEPTTFTRDVAPILFENCVSCHRPGEVAPMSLRTYDEARPWAKSIREKVLAREMPPWFADPQYGTFRNDARLIEDEIATIVRWVDQGARRGNPIDMPPVPELTEGWRLGEPDHIIELPEVQVPAEGNDYFPDLAFTADVPEDRWIRAVAIRPSQLEVAHHVVIFNGFSGGMGRDFNVLGVWAVGTPPNVYPEGMGRRLKSGQRLIANMHYHPNGTAVTDRTQIGLYFGEGELQHEVKAALAGSFTFEIPAGAPNHEERASWFVEDDMRIVSFFPHMHLRGKDMKFTAVYPNGDEKVLLSVPNYDFDWQLFYYPEELIELPAGTRIDLLAHYDNSAGNPDNPDPKRNVYFGTQSTDEMMFGVFEYAVATVQSRLTDAERLERMAATFPEDELYRVNFGFGGREAQALLHLPPEGDGQWMIAFSGMQVSVPVRNLVWDGLHYSSDVELRFGRVGGDFILKGSIADDGSLQGEFVSSDGAPSIIPRFEGRPFARPQ